MKTARLLAAVSRPEFIPANSASLIVGVAWGINLPVVDLVWELLIPVALVYAVISLVAAVAAQINTIADYELDLKDSSKKELVVSDDFIDLRSFKIVISRRIRNQPVLKA